MHSCVGYNPGFFILDVFLRGNLFKDLNVIKFLCGFVSQDEAIKNILGKDSSSMKLEDKLQKQRDAMA